MRREEEDDDEIGGDEEEPVSVPITDEIDLHPFRPQDIKEILEEYLRLAQEKGLSEVRIVHGKGRGQLMRTVHSILDRHPEVERYALASPYFGGEGATIANLK